MFNYTLKPRGLGDFIRFMPGAFDVFDVPASIMMRVFMNFCVEDVYFLSYIRATYVECV